MRCIGGSLPGHIHAVDGDVLHCLLRRHHHGFESSGHHVLLWRQQQGFVAVNGVYAHFDRLHATYGPSVGLYGKETAVYLDDDHLHRSDGVVCVGAEHDELHSGESHLWAWGRFVDGDCGYHDQ